MSTFVKLWPHIIASDTDTLVCSIGLAISRFLKIHYTLHFRPLIIDLNQFWPSFMMREAIGLGLNQVIWAPGSEVLHVSRKSSLGFSLLSENLRQILNPVQTC